MKVVIRWFDGMKRTRNVVDKQICSDNICLTLENGDEMWIPNKGVRYVMIPAQNCETKKECLAEQIKDVMLKRRLCDMEQSTISEIEDDLIATGTRPDNEKLIHTLNRMTEDGVIQTFLGVGNSKESGSVMDILYALMR